MSTSLEARLIKKLPFVLRDVDPTADDYHFDVPYLWLNREDDKIFILVDVTSTIATWIEIAESGTTITQSEVIAWGTL